LWPDFTNTTEALGGENVSNSPQIEMMTTNNPQVLGGENVPSNPHDKKTDLPTGEDLARLLERAEKGDVTVLPLLRRVLDETPALWQGYGDLSLLAQDALVKVAGGDNLLLCESLMRKLSALKSELMGESPSALEKLLVDRVASSWLHVNYYDALLVQSKKCSPAQIRLLQQQQDAAHRRYLAAIKTLATVRKLLTPARSPIEIATKLAGERSGLRLRQAPVEAGVPVEN
jgi:hypothetical protein